MKKQLFCSLVLGLVLAACNKEELPVTGSVSGTLTVYDPSTPLVKQPAKGVRVLLINKDFKIDTYNSEKNKYAIVDSVVSDSEGKYLISGFAEGNYKIVPFAEGGYNFTPENSEAVFSFGVNSDVTNTIINFTSPVPGNTNELIGDNSIPAGNYAIHFSIINDPNERTFKFERVSRLYYTFETYAQVNPTGYTFNLPRGKGYYNNLFDWGEITNDLIINGYMPVTAKYYASFRISWSNLLVTPDESTWEIDWTAKTIKQLP